MTVWCIVEFLCRWEMLLPRHRMNLWYVGGGTARKVGSEIDIAWFMPRLSFSALSLYSTLSLYPPLHPLPFITTLLPSLLTRRRNVCCHLSFAPSSLSLSLCLFISTRAAEFPHPFASLSIRNVSEVRQNLISARIARQNRGRVDWRDACFSAARHSCFSDQISAWKSSTPRFRGDRLPPFSSFYPRLFSVCFRSFSLSRVDHSSDSTRAN